MIRTNLVSMLALAALVLIAHFSVVHAAGDEPVLLRIEVSGTGDDAPRVTEMTMTDLTALPITEFSTHTNWTSGVQQFTGVSLLVLFDSLGVESGQIEMIAINDYSIILPFDDPTNKGAMVAYLQNGAPMTARGKGPLWLVYDYDADPAYRTETVFSRSIWQLDRMVISR